MFVYPFFLLLLLLTFGCRFAIVVSYKVEAVQVGNSCTHRFLKMFLFCLQLYKLIVKNWLTRWHLTQIRVFMCIQYMGKTTISDRNDRYINIDIIFVFQKYLLLLVFGVSQDKKQQKQASNLLLFLSSQIRFCLPTDVKIRKMWF